MALTRIQSGMIDNDAVGIVNLNATGTASVYTFLRGDGSWAEIPPGSTSTFDFIQIGTGTYKMFIGESPTPFGNQFFITGNEQPDDRLFFDQWQVVQFNSTTTLNADTFVTGKAVFSQTATIQSATIGLNTGTGARSFGYGFMPYNANNMKIELPNNGSSLFFAMKSPSGVERNVGISRQGNIVFGNGLLGNGFPNGIGLQSLDGGSVNINASFDDGVTSPYNQVFVSTSTGISLNVSNYEYGPDNYYEFSATLGMDGVFTVPSLTATTASITTIRFADNTEQTTAYTGGGGGGGIYARSALPAGTPGTIITVSDSGSDTNSPAGNWAPAYWDDDAGVWTYIGNSNSVTAI